MLVLYVSKNRYLAISSACDMSQHFEVPVPFDVEQNDNCLSCSISDICEKH